MLRCQGSGESPVTGSSFIDVTARRSVYAVRTPSAHADPGRSSRIYQPHLDEHSQGPDGDEILSAPRGMYNNVSLAGGAKQRFLGEQLGGQLRRSDITLEAIKEFQVWRAANAEFTAEPLAAWSTHHHRAPRSARQSISLQA